MREKTTAQKTEFKKQILESCSAVLEKRIEAAAQAMQQAQEAANSEGKSSAGDKYETSRAMGQLDRNMNARQLEEAKRDLAYIHSLKETELSNSIQPGSVVVTEQHIFFISLGLGTTTVGDQKIFLLSASAPVAREMEGKKSGDSFLFNGKVTEMLDVF